MTYKMIKQNYTRGLWNAAMVAKAVEKGVITATEYKTITGKKYSA